MAEPIVNWRRRDAAVAVVGLILLLAWDASGADLPLSRLFGNGDGFALRHHWLVQHVLHDAVAQCLHVIFVLLGVNVLFPLPVIGAMPRAQRLGWWLMSLLCALAISLLKHQSRVSCPWNFAEFGGSARELAHLSLAAWRGGGDGGPGHCFPAGHVSNAFALVGGTFALRTVSMRASRLWLVSVCVTGFVLGLTQLLRGAHFPSHSLWTAWICWTVSALLWHSGRRYACRLHVLCSAAHEQGPQLPEPPGAPWVQNASAAFPRPRRAPTRRRQPQDERESRT